MPTRLLRWTLPIFAVLSTAPPAVTQETVDHRGTWLSLFVGHSNVGFLPAVELSTRRGVHGIALRGVTAMQIRFFSLQTRAFAELGVLYGPHLEMGRSLVTVRAGPSMYWYGSDDPSNERTSRVGPRVGLPLEFQVIGRLGNNLGAGLVVMGDLNSTKRFLGVAMGLHLGDTR
jgi:hypothetical protein